MFDVIPFFTGNYIRLAVYHFEDEISTLRTHTDQIQRDKLTIDRLYVSAVIRFRGDLD